jgi:hypothetical protein
MKMSKDKHLGFFLSKLKSEEWIYKDGKILKWIITKKHWKEVGRLTNKGYRQVTGNINGTEVNCVAHRLIYAYVHGLEELPVDKEINHINGRKDDNCIENLELVSPSENQKHAYKIGLKVRKYGEENQSAKLSNREVMAIKVLIENGGSNSEIAKFFDCTPENINHIKKGVKWKQIN